MARPSARIATRTPTAMPMAKSARLERGPNQVVNAAVVGSWATAKDQAFHATDTAPNSEMTAMRIAILGRRPVTRRHTCRRPTMSIASSRQKITSTDIAQAGPIV